jgi:nucleotide-binding universal stress UspA family protein
MANTIVVGFDGSVAAKAALTQAIDLAKDLPEAEIVIACGHDRTPGWLGYEPLWKAAMEMEKLWDEMESRIAQDLEEAAESVRAAGVKAATACSRGNPAAIVVGVARETGARLIVVGARGAGAQEETTVLGSTTTELLHTAHVPVLVVPA